MGSWNETCSLTTTPILPGAPVVVVRIDKALKEDMYEQGFDGSMFQIHHILTIDKGTYDDYGWIEETENPDDFTYVESPGKSIDNRGRCYTLFFHQGVWDQVVALKDTEVEDYIRRVVETNRVMGKGEPPELLTDFMTVLGFARRVRRDILAGDLFHGMQHYERKEYRLLEKVTKEALKTIK